MIELINIEKEFNTNKALYYNLHIKIDSMNQLFNEGWKVIRLKSEKNGKKENLEKQVAIVSVLGNKNSGKSFFLSLLTNKKIPNGYSVTTEGLSFIIPDNDKNKDDNFILIDTAGTESPILSDISYSKEIKIEEKENEEENKKENKKEKPTIENMMKDRQITDYFIQKFILEKSDIFICVVDCLTLTDQKFINRIIKYIENKKIFIVHNLKTFIKKHQVEEYIQDTLLQSLTFDLKKEEYYDFTNHNEKDDKNKYFFKQNLKEDDRIIIHLIMANQDSEAGKYYNDFAISFINTQLRQVKEKKPFDIVQNLKTFLVGISGEIFKTKLEDTSIEEDENKIKVKANKLELKDCFIDVLGNSIIKDKIFKPNYRYGFFVDNKKKENKLFIEIELYAKWEFSQEITRKDNHFIIHIEGKNTIPIPEREYIDYSYIPGNEFSLDVIVGNDKGYLSEEPTVTEKNGLYIFIYTIISNHRDEEIITDDSDGEEDNY